MTTHRLKCPLEIIECEYYSIGCRDTMACKDQSEHKKEKMEEHLHLTSNNTAGIIWHSHNQREYLIAG